MTLEPSSEPKRPRHRLQRLSQDLIREWEYTRAAFDAYRELPPHRKYRALGKVFEKICPWIERGIQATVLNQFVLLPTEQVVSRMFASTVQKEALPRSYLLYMYWIESSIMRSLVVPTERYVVVKQTIGEPSVALCERFNKMHLIDRAILYLFAVEGCTPTEVCDNTGVPYAKLLEDLPKLWDALTAEASPSEIPKHWIVPRPDEAGFLRT